MKPYTFIILLLIGLLSLPMASCSTNDENTFIEIENPDEDDTENNNNGNNTGTEAAKPEEIDPEDGDLIPNTQNVTGLFDNIVSITYNGSTVAVENPFQESGITITTEGAHVTVTSTNTSDEVNYVLSGITTDGSVKFYGSYKFGIVLNGVGITNPSGAAINNQCGKKTTVTLVDHTTNRLIDAAEYTMVTGEDQKGTFFSEGQLVFEGEGTLEVRGKYKHAICTDDYFRINSGTIIVKEAASDAVHANDYIRIDGGSLKTISEGEGLECEKGYVVINGGDIQLTTTGQKGHGIKSKQYLDVYDGAITILVSGTASKGINVTEDLNIYGGTFNITTTGNAYFDTDDNDTSSCAAMKCDGNMLIQNGRITLYSSGSGGKGINVGGTLTIDDGTITVTTTGDQYVYDRNSDTAAKAIKSTGDLTVNGGKITISTAKTEAEGLESKATLTINGGELDIRAYDDCINASNHIEITGGTIYCYSETNDGVDSNGTLTISGGTIVSVGAGAPEDGFDCDQNRFSITGGVAIGIGGSTSTPTASACTQHSLIYKGSNFSLLRIEKTSDSSEVLTFKLPRTYNSTTVLVTTPNLAANTGYTIYTGGSVTGGTDFHGYYTGANYTKGSSAGIFSTSSMVSSVGTTGGGGGSNPGGNPGGRM